MRELVGHMEGINRLLARYGVKFGIYKNKEFHEQLFPFDPLARVITAEEFAYLERGLTQRVDALNGFLADIYSDKKIVKDGVIPEDFIFSSKGYLPQCEGITPPKKIYSHISGIDLVQGKDGSWYILDEDGTIIFTDEDGNPLDPVLPSPDGMGNPVDLSGTPSDGTPSTPGTSTPGTTPDPGQNATLPTDTVPGVPDGTEPPDPGLPPEEAPELPPVQDPEIPQLPSEDPEGNIMPDGI